MRVEITKPLFAWDALADSPTLKTVKHHRFLRIWRSNGLAPRPSHSYIREKGRSAETVPSDGFRGTFRVFPNGSLLLRTP